MSIKPAIIDANGNLVESGVVYLASETEPIQSIYNAGNVTTNYAFDAVNGKIQKCTLTGSTTFTFVNAVIGNRYLFEFIENGTGGYTITLFSGITWCTSAPTFSTTANKRNIVGIYCIASNTYIGYNLGTGL